MAELKKSIAQNLIETGRLSSDELKQAEEEAQVKGLPLDELLVRKNYLTEEERGILLADQMGVLYVDLENYLIDPKVTSLIPEDLAKKYRLLPMFHIKNTLTVAMS